MPTLDLRGVPCPLSFVRTKLRLEQLSIGDALEVLLDSGEAIEQVPASLALEGHQTQSVEEKEGFWQLIVQKGSI